MRSVEGTEIRAFLDRFRELYRELRHGATYIVQRPRDPVNVKRLLTNFDPARLEALTRELLTTKEEWIAKTDRRIGILAVKATWLDAQLCERAAKAQRRAPNEYVPLRFRKEA